MWDILLCRVAELHSGRARTQPRRQTNRATYSQPLSGSIFYRTAPEVSIFSMSRAASLFMLGTLVRRQLVCINASQVLGYMCIAEMPPPGYGPKHCNLTCKPPAHVSRYLKATTSLKDEYVAWMHGKVAHTALPETSAETESSQYSFKYDSGCVVARQQLTVCSCCRSHEVNRGAPFWENSEGTDSQASSLLSAQALLVTWSHQSACRLMLLQES